ncbi:MAG TPA: hypothetical protein VMD52_02160 [Patescibacteria group bacterium]|nr:hypothetical protein [Patescibacteria group bacterium]
MRNVKIAGLIGCLICAFFCRTYAQQNAQPVKSSEPVLVSVTGQLTEELFGKTEELVLHSDSGDTYYILGKSKESLKKSLSELGKNNLVSVSGTKTGKRYTVCDRKVNYASPENAPDKPLITATCIHYWALEVNEVLSVKKSDTIMPSPKRDAQEEQRAIAMLLQERQKAASLPTMDIQGTILSTDFLRPVKTIEVANLDKTHPMQKVVLVLKPATSIAKQAVGNEEPMRFAMTALRAGQQIRVQFSYSDVEKVALAIVILKE